MNADAVARVLESITELMLRVACVWAMLGVGIFFLIGAVVNLDEWRERKRENARYKR